MAVAERSVSTAVKATTGNLGPLTFPTGHAANDILIARIVGADNAVGSGMTGWTLKLALNNGTGTRYEEWWKRDNGSEAAPTLTRTGTKVSSVGWITAYTGVDPSWSDPYQDYQSQTGTGTATNPFNVTHPAITGVLIGDLRMTAKAFGLTSDTSGVSANAFTPPTGFTERIDTVNITGAGASAGSSDDKVASANGEGGSSFTSTADWEGGTAPAWISIHAALRSDSPSVPATAAGQMGWGTMGGGDMGTNFGAAGGTQNGAATIAGQGGVTLDASVEHNAASTINALGATTLVANEVHAGAATINALSSVSAAGYNQKQASATINAQATTAPAGTVEKLGAATVNAQGSNTAGANAVWAAASTINALSTISPTATVSTTVLGAATINALGSVAANGNEVYASDATINAQSATSIAGYNQKQAAATVNAQASITADGQVTRNGAATINALGTTSLTGYNQKQGAATINALGSVAANANEVHAAAATVNALGATSVAGYNEKRAAATVNAQASIAADAQVTHNASSTIAAVGATSLHWH
jgi:hypothetical protein